MGTSIKGRVIFSNILNKYNNEKTIISTLCFLAIIQFSVAQSNDNKDRNKIIYRELNQLVNDGKLAEGSKYYAESHEVKGIGKGPKAVEASALGYRKIFPDLNVRIIELIAEADLVMARCEATGTQKGEMDGIPATGKTGKIAHWTINRFNEEGKITESWNLNDTMSMMNLFDNP